MNKEIEEVIEKYKTGLKINQEITESKTVSTIEKNRATYMVNTLGCFIHDLEQLKKTQNEGFKEFRGAVFLDVIQDPNDMICKECQEVQCDEDCTNPRETQPQATVSDEDIKSEAKGRKPYDTPHWNGRLIGFMDGAKWMRDKLQQPQNDRIKIISTEGRAKLETLGQPPPNDSELIELVELVELIQFISIHCGFDFGEVEANEKLTLFREHQQNSKG